MSKKCQGIICSILWPEKKNARAIAQNEWPRCQRNVKMSGTFYTSDLKNWKVARFLPSDHNDTVTAFWGVAYALTQRRTENAARENQRITKVKRRISATHMIASWHFFDNSKLFSGYARFLTFPWHFLWYITMPLRLASCHILLYISVSNTQLP